MATPHKRFKSLSDRLKRNPRSLGKMFRKKSKSSVKDMELTDAVPSSKQAMKGKTAAARSAKHAEKLAARAHAAGMTTGPAAEALAEMEISPYRVVVAIDFGTTYSGYAYAFRRKPDDIHLMRRKEAGQVGVPSHKIPTILLLDEREQFYAFGYDARDAYHDMSEEESQRWLYFEKFKMELHSRKVCYVYCY